MTMFYSVKSNGFYDDELTEKYEASGTWPEDALKISYELYSSLLDGQRQGKIIDANSDGQPILIDPVINWRTRAESQRQNLLTSANTMTADWRTELQLDVISEEDKASLIKWMAYIKALKALDLSGVNEEVGYEAITWPIKPGRET
ncbi:tail fiber assembly protein [Pantoea agglomerans]|uniref:tail fiber assembly protein n=1 Tax=Enterobacter agglomerans TaxID=549 RepID=UPI0024130E5D|nr:tail fiber assembly protein [Pantoea agglomerans]